MPEPWDAEDEFREVGEILARPSRPGAMALVSVGGPHTSSNYPYKRLMACAGASVFLPTRIAILRIPILSWNTLS